MPFGVIAWHVKMTGNKLALKVWKLYFSTLGVYLYKWSLDKCSGIHKGERMTHAPFLCFSTKVRAAS